MLSPLFSLSGTLVRVSRHLPSLPINGFFMCAFNCCNIIPIGWKSYSIKKVTNKKPHFHQSFLNFGHGFTITVNWRLRFQIKKESCPFIDLKIGEQVRCINIGNNFYKMLLLIEKIPFSYKFTYLKTSSHNSSIMFC